MGAKGMSVLGRSLGLVLALLIGLVVVTGPEAPAQASTTKRSVSLKSSAGTLIAGRQVTLSGKVTRSPKGTAVTIQAKLTGAWSTLAKVRTTTAKGDYRLTVPRTEIGLHRFRATVARQNSGGKTLAAATSPIQKVTVIAGPGMRVVSANPDGASGNASSYLWSTRQGSAMSSDGRYVVYRSEASDLVPGDTNGVTDIFLFDRATNRTRIVSAPPSGQANGGSHWPTISPDGEWIVFTSNASNLVANAPPIGLYRLSRTTGSIRLLSEIVNGGGGVSSVSNGGTSVAFTNMAPTGGGTLTRNIFVWNAGEGVVPVSTLGGSGYADEASWAPVVSGDGRWIAYESFSDGIAAGDDDDYLDIYLFDNETDDNTLVTGHREGAIDAAISADGRFLAYASSEATSGRTQIYLRNRATGVEQIVSRTSGGTPGNGHSRSPFISANGAYVVFETPADNLDAADINPDTSSNGTDVYLWSRSGGGAQVISRHPGVGQNRVSEMAQVSADGRWVSFASYAALIDTDTNATGDIYLWDRLGTP